MEEKMDDEIEKIVNTFDKIDEQTYFMKEQISKLKPITPKINFENCHIAISKNGGLMAFVKKHKVFIMESNNPIKENIRVFCQDGSNEKRIKFPYDKEEQYIVYFDFTDEEVLYAIMTDGILYKIDIFSNRVIQKTTGNIFKNDNIVSAKFFMKGFVALTKKGNFYVIRSFKEMSPILFFEMNKLLHIPYVPCFQFLPPNAGKTNKIELIIPVIKDDPNQIDISPDKSDKKYIGHGIINIVEQEKYEVSQSGSINGVYYIKRKKIEPWYEECGFEPEEQDDIPQICSIAASPNYKQIALYNRTGKIILLDSSIENEEKPPRILKLSLNPKFKDDQEKDEQLAVMDFHGITEFCFCGEDAICLAGRRFLFLAPVEGGIMVYKMTNRAPMASMMSSQFMKCLTEVDGLRVLMSDSVYFINQVPFDLYDACYPFSEASSKKLITAYNASENRDANCDKLIREIQAELPKAITSLQNAASCLWRKEVQMYMLKAAQHGKNFVQKEDFNFDSFVEICKDIRIINNLRDSEQPRLITYKEYKTLNNNYNPKELIKRILQTQDFYLAFQISKFLDYNVKKVYQKYAIAQIKHLNNGLSESEELESFERINKKLEGVSNISYIKLAKKSFKYGKQNLGMKFLEKEKSILTKIPQYIELKQWDKALELAFKTYDSNVVTTVLDKIMKIESLKDFFLIVRRYRKADSAVIEYLKKNLPNELPNYLYEKKNDEELFFVYLEDFFKSKSVVDRRDYLNKARDTLKRIESIKDNNNSTFDVKFYNTYLKDLTNSINLKRDLLNDNVVIKETDVGPFDNSIYDVFKSAIKMAKYGLVENKNRMFELPLKKLSILRIRSYAEMKDLNAVVAMYTGEHKKTLLTPINFAEIFVENELKDRAADAISKVTDPDYFDYKIEMLKQIEKYDAALQIIITDKNCEIDRKEAMVKDILTKRPDLLALAQELSEKSKIDLGL